MSETSKHRRIFSSLTFRLVFLSTLTMAFIISTGWALIISWSRDVSNNRWNSLLLLEAETKARITQSREEWEYMHHGGRDDFIRAEDVRPVYMILAETNVVFYKSSNWPRSITPNQLPLARFLGQTAEHPETMPYRRSDMTHAWGQHRDSLLWDRSIGGKPWRFALAGSDDNIFILGYAHEEIFREPHQIQKVIVGASFAILILVTLMHWLTTRQALKPIQDIVQITKDISGSSLTTRLDSDTGSRELDSLTEVINAMLDRLDKSFQLARRFTSDASHELKTPLTVLYGRLNRALQQAEKVSDQKLFAGLLGEVERLTAIVEKLLLLSRAESGALQLRLEIIDLSEMVSLLSEDIGHLDDTVVVRSDVQRGIGVNGDSALLQQVFYNLASNAVKYSLPESVVDIQLRQNEDRVCVTISNPSETISDENRDRIFDRFYRFDPAHSREKEGAGLGLSLAKEIVLAHKGTIELDTSKDGYAVFRVWIPSL